MQKGQQGLGIWAHTTRASWPAGYLKTFSLDQFGTSCNQAVSSSKWMMWHTSSTFSYFANSCLFNLSQISQGANIGNERFRFFPPGQKQYETVRTEKGVGALERSRKQEEIRRAFLLFSCGAEWSCGLLECSQECSFGVCYDCYEILSFGFRMFPAPTRPVEVVQLVVPYEMEDFCRRILPSI